MKTFASLALTLVLTAACLVGCGCTNRNMDDTSAPTVLPTNEEIWNSTETTTHQTTETTAATETTGAVTEESTEESRGINETEVHNYVNAQQDLNEKIKENERASKSSTGSAEGRTSRMMPGTR